MAVVINRKRNRNGQRRERAQRARHDEVFPRGLDAAFGALAGDKTKADGEQAIASQRIARRGVAGNDV